MMHADQPLGDARTAAAGGGGVARILFVGDISLTGAQAASHGRRTADRGGSFRHVRPVFESADLRIGNLESPLHRGESPRPKRNLLGAPAASVGALDELGFTAVSLANNHITDQGLDGLEGTREVLGSRGIACFGAGKNLEEAAEPVVIRANGLSFALLGYAVADKDVCAQAATACTEGCVPFSAARVAEDVRAAGKWSSHVVVSLHWGYQFDHFPSPAQRELAHRIIDAGALIVYGHHPHVLQGVERYGDGLILYSMGNFSFPDFVRTDGVRFRFPREARKTAAVICDVDASGVTCVSTTPLVSGHTGDVRPLRGPAATRASRSLARRSAALSSPGFESLWDSHHRRTVRWRRSQEERLHISGELVSIGRSLRARGVRGALASVRGRQIQALFQLARRFVRSLAR